MLFLFIADGVPVGDKDVVVYAVRIHDNFEFSYMVSSSQTCSRWPDSVSFLSFHFTCI